MWSWSSSAWRSGPSARPSPSDASSTSDGVPDRRDAAANRSQPGLFRSLFFCNSARKGSLVCGIIAFVALVIGGGFAEISSSGSPTSLETAVVRWVILAALVAGVTLYVIGGRLRRDSLR